MLSYTKDTRRYCIIGFLCIFLGIEIYADGYIGSSFSRVPKIAVPNWLGIVAVAYGFYSLLKGFMHISKQGWSNYSRGAMLLLGGLLGPLVVLYLESRLKIDIISSHYLIFGSIILAIWGLILLWRS